MSPTWSLCLCVLEVEWVTVVSKWKGYWSVELRAYDSERERESKAAKCERCSSCTGAGHVTAPIILIGHNNAYWPSSSTDSADHPDDNECVCVYQLFIRSQYMGAAQAINDVIRRTMRTLQCNHKTNVSLVPHAHTHAHNIHPHLEILEMKCSPATIQMWRLTRPPSLMSWFRSIQCTHTIAQGHKHTYTSTWYGIC